LRWVYLWMRPSSVGAASTIAAIVSPKASRTS
jgi:hypothetical protein